MKNLFFSLVLLFPALANAKAWRVDNTGNPAAQFTTLGAAIAASTVAAGDTLYIYGSAASYGSVAVNKRLVILGMGYNWAVNYLSAVPIAQIDCMNFATGSEGSLISGMRIGTGTGSSNALYLSVDGITVKRNYVSSIHAASSTNACTSPSSSVNRQAVISQNWIYGYYSDLAGLYNIYGTIDHNLIAYRMQVPISSVISHNVVCYSNQCSTSYLNYFLGSVIENNIFWGTTSGRVVNAFGSVLRNNVFPHASSTSVGDTSNGLENNVFSAAMSNVFENSSNTSLDGSFRLKAGSPALAAGTGGVDIGAFGGTGAYALGVPPTVPIIYFFNSATNASASLPIEIRIISK